MFSSIVALAASLLFGFAPMFSDQGGGTDPDGRQRAAAVSSDQGGATDPDGRTRAALARRAASSSSDQGTGTDPDGKPSR